MATDQLLPPACAFAQSILVEYAQDPEAVPEEAVEAAQLHIATCARCQGQEASANGTSSAKKRKTRRKTGAGSSESSEQTKGTTQTLVAESAPSAPPTQPTPVSPSKEPMQAIASSPAQVREQEPQTPIIARQSSAQTIPTPSTTSAPAAHKSGLALDGGPIDCQQCRQLLPEYAEAMDDNGSVASLYPEVQEHLLTCESGCLVLLDIYRQEAKATRKYRRRPVRNPFSAIWWELTGFFRGGHVPISPMALSYGTLLLLLLVASLSSYLAIRWDDARYYHPPVHARTIPTPDGVGLSDGLQVFDACNASSYQYKREAAQALRQNHVSQADALFSSAMNVPLSDTTGCSGAEAAIYDEDLHVRQSGRPFGVIVVSFDSGPGSADPQGGTDRHALYAAYTQELVGAYIAQHLYNSAQMETPDAPLLYLVLANTTGTEQGALQIASAIASMDDGSDLRQAGLVASGSHPMLAALGLGPSNLTEVALPTLCQAGVPLIAPTATGLFILPLLQQTSLYRHCAPGFSFIRFSPDDAAQAQLDAFYAYRSLHARNAAIFYDPSNPASSGSAQAFLANFPRNRGARIVAQETIISTGLLDDNGSPQGSRDDLLAGLHDALQAKPRPDLIFAPLLTNDVITLAQAIAQLPANQQPVLMIAGEFVQPSALQALVPWARQQQLTLPHIFVSAASAARSPTSGNTWQKQFYASFCTSFATPGSYCSGAAALDQGALLFADGIEVVLNAIGPISDINKMPTSGQLVQRISKEKLAGVSGTIALHSYNSVIVTSAAARPVILSMQQDGSIQIVD